MHLPEKASRGSLHSSPIRIVTKEVVEEELEADNAARHDWMASANSFSAAAADFATQSK